MNDQEVEKDLSEPAEQPVNEETVSTSSIAEQTEVNNTEKLEAQLAEANDKYLRLYSEFDNFKRRTNRERLELIKTAGEDFFKSVLPVVDDFERGLKAMNDAADVQALREGVELIYNKMSRILQSKGLEPMKTEGEVFDADLHEALTNIPAPSEDLKGKIVEEIEKGYTLNGKVIRFAKVVVGN